ncbi:tripartite motif-containing protein 60-like, partial [Orycteropus afer afer]|uniref:Tripartite motif-containing protein 60-like n=1 Tax=Orycteropus afer afer TaxID=1230840 RepID=A0A8B7BDH6_ORYAF
CGHNFCRPCIHQCWEDLQDVFPCPVCLHPCLDRNFRRNTQLCHMIDIVKQIPTTKSKRTQKEEKPLCGKHNEVLSLFCEKDLELLCSQCSISSHHSDHHLMTIEEAATNHRQKLKSYIKTLKKQVEDAEKGSEMQASKSFKLWRKVENKKRELNFEYEQLKRLLGKEQDAIFLKLLMEEKDINEKLIENQILLSDHISTLKNLLSEITEKCVQADLELLTDIDSIHNRYKNLKTPVVFSYELKEEHWCLPPQHFGLQKMINIFKVDLTLDLDRAFPNLIISEDRKSVKYGKMKMNLPYNPKRFTGYPAVLSSEGFTVGRHFWQVEVRGTGEWAVGVCKDSFPPNATVSSSAKDGCWQIQHWTDTCGTNDRVKLMQIGIFLDYDLGEVSFYNMNNRSHIYTFTDTFTEKLWAYFSTGHSSNTLTI